MRGEGERGERVIEVWEGKSESFEGERERGEE